MLLSRYVLIIIPTYNRAHFLPEAIQSVLLQDYPFKKIVIVDDGSTDDTRELCTQYVDTYKGIIFYEYQPNSGCSTARNRGLSAIDDDIGYVCFLDSDDKLLAGKLAREVALLNSHKDVDFTYSGAIVFDELSGNEEFQQVAASEDPSQFAIQHFLTYEAKPAALMYRVSVLKDMRFREDLRYNEDSEFLQRVAFVYKGVNSLTPGCWVRWHSHSKSRNLLEILRAVLLSIQDIPKQYPDFYKANQKSIDQRISKVRRDLAIETLIAKQWKDVSLYTSNLLLILQAKIHFSGYYNLKRKINIWLISH